MQQNLKNDPQSLRPNLDYTVHVYIYAEAQNKEKYV